MPPGRPTPPLFDLLPKTPAGDPPPATPAQASPPLQGPPPRHVSEKPVVRVDLVAQKPPTPASPPPAQASSGGASGIGRAMEPLLAGPTVIVPRNAILVGVAVLILLAIGIWVLGVKYGVSTERAEVAREFGGAQPPIRDPLTTPGGGTDPLVAPGGGREGGTQPRNQGDGRPSGTAPRGPVTPENRPSGGQTQPPAVAAGADPRVSGLNYYAIVLVPKEKAEEIVAFLTQNKVDSFAIPERVDTGGRSANNTDPGAVRYRVFLQPGITGAEYGANGPKRQQVESDAVRLAEVWKRERRTGNLVAQPGWYKYNR